MGLLFDSQRQYFLLSDRAADMYTVRPAKGLITFIMMARPRRCVTMHRVLFVLGRNYRCNNCCKQFNNLADDVTSRLPECIKKKLLIVFTHWGAIERYFNSSYMHVSIQCISAKLPSIPDDNVYNVLFPKLLSLSMPHMIQGWQLIGTLSMIS